jgi:hypothetical protein
MIFSQGSSTTRSSSAPRKSANITGRYLFPNTHKQVAESSQENAPTLEMRVQLKKHSLEGDGEVAVVPIILLITIPVSGVIGSPRGCPLEQSLVAVIRGD